jgi:hypothetical protein
MQALRSALRIVLVRWRPMVDSSIERGINVTVARSRGMSWNAEHASGPLISPPSPCRRQPLRTVD